MLKIKNKIFLPALILVVLFLSGIVTLLNPSTSSADVKDTPYISDVYNEELYKQLSAHQHYWWLYACFQNVDIDKVTESEVDSWDFFEGSGIGSELGAMYSPNSDGGYGRKCNDQSVVKTAFTYLGYTDTQSREVFCFIKGAEYKDDRDGDGDDCIAGAGDHDWDNNADRDEIVKWYKEKILPKKPALTAPGSYMRSFTSFVEGCDVKFTDTTTYDSSGEVPGAGGSTKYAVPIVVKEGDAYQVKYVLGVGLPGNTKVSIVAADNSDGGVKKQDCNSLVNEARDNVGAYKEYVQRAGSTVEEDETEAGGGELEESSCAVDGIGWIVCPVVTFLGKLNDAAYGFLNNFLTISPKIFNDPATNAAWSAFRNIANVAFVISFLVIIYSQITGGGVTNYGIKKMLPRLIVAAILVNVSFYICAIAVDLSNIVGSSAYDLLKDSISTTTPGGGGGAMSSLWTDAIAILLGAGAILGLLALIIFAPMSLLAFALVIMILIGRQAFVILLIVVSPLAFVAYLLPNTEQWFKKWWKAFSAMLMVFPIIAVVFGASTLASRILLDVSQDNFGGGDDEQMLKIVGAGVMAIPLFAVPLLLKGSLSAAGSIGTKLAGLQDKANRGAGKAIKEGRIGEAKTAFDARRQTRALDRRVGTGKRFGIIPSARINKAIDKSKFGRVIGGDRGAAKATSALFKEYGEEVGRQKDTMTSLDQDALMKIVTDKNASQERRAAAAGVIGSRSYRKGHQELLDYIGDEQHVGADGKVDETIKNVQQQTAHDMKDQPIGMGDTDKSELGEGRWTKPTGQNNAGEKRTVSEQALLDRLHAGKMSAQSFASMNPDDLILLEKLKKDGITTEAQRTIDSVIDELNKPEMSAVYAASKANAREAHTRLHS